MGLKTQGYMGDFLLCLPSDPALPLLSCVNTCGSTSAEVSAHFSVMFHRSSGQQAWADTSASVWPLVLRLAALNRQKEVLSAQS